MKRIEYLLIALALTMLGCSAWSLIETRLYQRFHKNDFAQNGTLNHPSVISRARPHLAVPEGTAVGKIEIPRIGVSAIIAEGEAESTLQLAVGHVPGTAFPGEEGNVGLAGHRDSFFRPLARIRVHDEIRLSTEGGAASLYRVDSIAVVEPTEISVLDRGLMDSVTLVTCYPFRFIGAAPKRFVVKAGRVVPDPISLQAVSRNLSPK